MADKPVIKIGHLQITNHFIHGITKDKLEKVEEKLQHLNLEIQNFVSWNPLKQALKDGSIEAAFILAPLATETYPTGRDLRRHHG
jgi:NitT/TauT family transport system substrate-binding protein